MISEQLYDTEDWSNGCKKENQLCHDVNNYIFKNNNKNSYFK